MIIAVILIGIIAWIVMPQEEATQVPDIEIASSVESGITAEQLYQRAKELLEDRELLKTKEIYIKILSEYSDYEFMENVQKDLENLNMQIILSNAQSPEAVIHIVQSGDTLGKLASQNGTTIDLIKIRNNLKSNVIRIDQRLSIWTGEFDILIDKSQNILLLKSKGEIVKTYDVATGENNSTPVGKSKINSKLKDPVWFKQGGVVVPPESPANELGSRWLGFDTMKGYGIHGTVRPETIGTQSTLGCVRMRNEDVEELFNLIRHGTVVKIID